jgi:hypothetical protein
VKDTGQELPTRLYAPAFMRLLRYDLQGLLCFISVGQTKSSITLCHEDVRGSGGIAPPFLTKTRHEDIVLLCSLPVVNRKLGLWCLWQVQEHGMKFLLLQVPRRNSIPRYWQVTKPSSPVAVSWCSGQHRLYGGCCIFLHSCCDVFTYSRY